MCKIPHRVPSYKITGDERECVSIGCFELDHATLPTNIFQSIKQHDQVQKNFLGAF